MRPSDYDQEELMLMLQDTLTQAASGRTDGLRCPICERGEVVVEDGDEGWIKIECPQCGLKFEGLLGNSEDSYSGGGSGKVRNPFG
jgi:hypothetical protein